MPSAASPANEAFQMVPLPPANLHCWFIHSYRFSKNSNRPFSFTALIKSQRQNQHRHHCFNSVGVHREGDSGGLLGKWLQYNHQTLMTDCCHLNLKLHLALWSTKQLDKFPITATILLFQIWRHCHRSSLPSCHETFLFTFQDIRSLLKSIFKRVNTGWIPTIDLSQNDVWYTCCTCTY